MKSALWLPLFDELADPRAVIGVAAEAEEAGWHGVFVWGHLRWRAPVRQVGDPWITLAAIATDTEQVRLGPMVMPLPRRRPAKVARESVTLDLAGGASPSASASAVTGFAHELSRPSMVSATPITAWLWPGAAASTQEATIMAVPA